ncbi:MAG: hypothetical protein Q8933_10845 [Bacteroidota bacterium]|nr:hypothetical protein [Bacteroidota bacterium]
MKVKIKAIICFSILSAAAAQINAQQLYSANPFFKSIFESRKNINSYYTGDNPAYLNYENGDQLLSLKSVYNNSDGKFKKFIDPSTTELYQVSASGKKNIDSFQVFKGSFGFQRIERKDWNWLASKYYEDFNPFLFGDSTTGTTHYNGIVMNAQYNALIYEKFLLGFMFNYSVDQGLKEVFPRPTTDHRDIDLKLGAGYLLSNSLSLGASVKIYDYNEKILYQEDESDVSREVFLLKFKGFDFPFVNKKKTETRYNYKNGFFSYGNISYLKDDYALAAYFGGGLEQSTIKEDAVNPVTQGYWKNQVYEGAFRSGCKLTEGLYLGLNYDYREDNMWAKHPSTSVLMMENYMPKHSLYSGLEYAVSNYLSLGLEGGFELNKIDYNDYYSTIFWNVKGNTISASAGCDILWSTRISSSFAYGISKFSVKSSNLTQILQSQYYLNYRLNDVMFYMTDFMKHSLNTVFSIQPAKWGVINIYISYSTMLAEENPLFNKLHRNDFNSSVELKIRAY